MKTQSGQLVVGIDGSAAAGTALEWAADEAERRGAPLVVAYAGHIPHRGALTEDTARSSGREICAFGRELLADAVATVAESSPRVDARTTLCEVDPATMLIDFSDDSALLVVGRGNGGILARFVLGSVSQRVAGHAHCPVVVIESRPESTDTIVVGVSASEGGRRAMYFACAEAVTRGTRVLAVRSWGEIDEAVTAFNDASAVPFAALHESEQTLLDGVIRAARAQFPTVPIQSQLTASRAYLALTDAARTAPLLVVGCRRAEGSHLPRLGPVASWLMHHSPCPLAIVGQTADQQAVGATAPSSAIA